MKALTIQLLLAGWLPLTGLTADKPAGAWTSIFNGTDLTGWTVKCKPTDRNSTFWKVVGGVIVADSMSAPKPDYVWLMTDREYGDFVLRLQFQAFRDSPGNSGVQIRSRYDDEAGWLDGPQIDIHPPGPWRTGMIWDETRGVQHWLYPAVPKGQWVNESMANPDLKFHFNDDPVAWNDLEITARGTRIQVILNGVILTDYDGAGVLDDAIHRERRTGTKGHIALQIHSGDQLRIRFRDLRIKELPGEK
jgi:hypothetical protein